MGKLTKKQRGFITDYVETGNASLAARQNYDVTDDATARMIGSENLTKPNIKQAVSEALASHSVTPEWIIGQHKGLVEHSNNDMAKTRNLEDLGQIADIYPNRQNRIDINTNIISISWQE
jgi:phage terminase small subunit